MFLDEVLNGQQPTHPILKECSEFLLMSGGLSLLKNLPSSYNDFRKVKLRMRKGKVKDEFARTFNEAFDEIPYLRQRAMFANGPISFVAESGEREPFYIFPINNFKFMYSLEVTNSSVDYMNAFEMILEQFKGDHELMEQVLKYTYTQENLFEGIEHGSEIILYNMPYCYAVRQSICEYDELLELFKIPNDLINQHGVPLRDLTDHEQTRLQQTLSCPPVDVHKVLADTLQNEEEKGV